MVSVFFLYLFNIRKNFFRKKIEHYRVTNRLIDKISMLDKIKINYIIGKISLPILESFLAKLCVFFAASQLLTATFPVEI